MVEIICTIGPSSFRKVKALKKAGMDIARLNFAYAKPGQLSLLKGIHAMADIRKVAQLKEIPKKYHYAAISFTNSAAQIAAARKLTDARIIAKIETKKGMKNLKEIVRASDIVMIARGDLADAIGIENIGVVQKTIAEECRRQKKPFIVATGILESMTRKTKPERAEVLDITNAILDGASYIMLSDETAIGKHPVEATRFLKKVIEKASRIRPKRS